MWKFFVELYIDNCCREYVENAEIEDELPICHDLNVAKQKWGNSQGIRIPKAFLDALGMMENFPVGKEVW